MAFADDLLQQAYHLARKERRNPKQASLRRAVSTACYALFHLLIDDAVAKWGVARHRSAFTDWRSIRESDSAEDFLLQLFLPKLR